MKPLLALALIVVASGCTGNALLQPPEKGHIALTIKHPHWHAPVFYDIPYQRPPSDPDEPYQVMSGGASSIIACGGGPGAWKSSGLSWGQGKAVYRDGVFACSLKVDGVAYAFSIPREGDGEKTFEDGTKISGYFFKYTEAKPLKSAGK